MCVRPPALDSPRPDQRSIPYQMLIKLVDDEGREEASGAGGRLKHTECPWRAQEEGGLNVGEKESEREAPSNARVKIWIHGGPGRPPNRFAQ